MFKIVIDWFKLQTRKEIDWFRNNKNGEKSFLSGTVSPSDISNDLLISETKPTKEKNIKEKSKRITLHARGIEFKVPLNQFQKFPETRLGKIKRLIDEPKSIAENLEDLCDKYESKTNTVYFNKDPFVLNVILNYYNNEKLHIEESECGYSMIEELEYWQIGEEALGDCCRERFYQRNEEIDKKLKEEAKIIDTYNKKHDFGTRFFPNFRAKVWDIIEHKETCLAKVTLLTNLNTVKLRLKSGIPIFYNKISLYNNSLSRSQVDYSTTEIYLI